MFQAQGVGHSLEQSVKKLTFTADSLLNPGQAADCAFRVNVILIKLSDII